MTTPPSPQLPPHQQAQLDHLLGPNPAHFTTLLTSLLSPSNPTRTEAETLYTLLKTHYPTPLSLLLTHTINTSNLPSHRSFSSILLRKLLPSLPPPSLLSLSSPLLTSLSRDPHAPTLKKLSYTISELALLLLPNHNFTELFPFLFSSLSAETTTPGLKECCLLILSQVVEFVRQHLIEFYSVVGGCLGEGNEIGVRVAALSAAVNLITRISEEGGEGGNVEMERWQELLPNMMGTLNAALNGGEEVTAQEALELLVDLAGSEPRFFRKRIREVVGGMVMVAEAEGLEEGVRHLAIEFVVTLAEGRERAPGMMRKLPELIGRVVAVLMRLLEEVEDVEEWYKAENVEDEDAGQSSNFGVAQECLDRLAISLGGNSVVPVVSEVLVKYLGSGEWQQRHAALICLAQIAEGCSKVMLKNLEQVLSMVLSSFQDPHPRVRWAATNAIGQLATDLGPDLQTRFHQLVLPALAGAMDDFQNPRVQAHAASAVLNFSENCTPDILTPYLDGIVSKLLVLLQTRKQLVQEGALTALASVADSSQELFQKYYDAVMPYLKAILVNATDKANRMLRAKAMECISLVGMAVGKNKFRDDAKQVMDVLMQIQGSQMEADDPTSSYMLQAWARLCKCLGQDFIPYMNVVMPPLLQSAQLEADVTFSSTGSDADVDDSDEDSIETITLGDKRYGIKTSVLEEKATACNMLCCYADELKEGFFPWIDQVAPALVPLLKFYFHEEVRKAAVSAMPELLLSAKLAVEKGLAQGRNEAYVKQLSDYIIPALLEALHKEPEIEICSSMLDALNECVQISGPLLDENQVRCIVDEIKRVIKASSSRKVCRAARAKAEDFDEDEGEVLKEENEQEEDLIDQVGDFVGTLIKTFKASFLPFFDDLSSHLTPLWGKDKSPEDRRIAICIFDDVVEQCREAALKYYGTYLPFLLEACNDENSDLRQAAVYGVGVCAEFGGPVFKPHVGEALSRLNAVIRHPNATHSDNVMAYDNAVSALGKICQFHRENIDAAQIVPMWLDCLPIKGDLVEAKVVHEQLCLLVERSDRDLLGPNNQYLPRIVAVFAEVLCAGKDLAAEKTTSRMINLLRQLQQTLPPSTLASTWSSLQPQQQLALQSILSQ